MDTVSNRLNHLSMTGINDVVDNQTDITELTASVTTNTNNITGLTASVTTNTNNIANICVKNNASQSIAGNLSTYFLTVDGDIDVNPVLGNVGGHVNCRNVAASNNVNATNFVIAQNGLYVSNIYTIFPNPTIHLWGGLTLTSITSQEAIINGDCTVTGDMNYKSQTLDERFVNVAGDIMTGDLGIGTFTGSNSLPKEKLHLRTESHENVNLVLQTIDPNTAGLYLTEAYASDTNYYGGSIRYKGSSNRLIFGTGNGGTDGITDAFYIPRNSTDVNFNGILNVRNNDNGDYLRFNGERSWLWSAGSSGAATHLRLKDEGNGKDWKYITQNDTEWARWTFNNNLDSCKLEFLGGKLIMSNNTEIEYKGETLDNRFVDKSGDTMTGSLDITGNLTLTGLVKMDGLQVINTYSNAIRINDNNDWSSTQIKGNTNVIGNLDVSDSLSVGSQSTGNMRLNVSSNYNYLYLYQSSTLPETYLYLDKASNTLRYTIGDNYDAVTMNSFGDVSVEGAYKVHNVPLISQVHTFTQYDLNALYAPGFFSHAPTYDANKNNPVKAIQSVCNMMPYALSISTDADGDSSTNFTFEIRVGSLNSTDANLTTNNTVSRGSLTLIGIVPNRTMRGEFSNPSQIYENQPWGLYLSSMSPNGYNGEVLIKVYFYQV